MIHERHFTPAQADDLLPALTQLLAELREAKESLTDEEAHAALADASGGNGGGTETDAGGRLDTLAAARRAPSAISRFSIA